MHVFRILLKEDPSGHVSFVFSKHFGASLVAQMVKRLPAMQKI